MTVKNGLVIKKNSGAFIQSNKPLFKAKINLNVFLIFLPKIKTMALIICRECKKELSTTAIKCPHCGANYYTASGTPTNNLDPMVEILLWCGVVVFLGAGGLALIGSLIIGYTDELKFNIFIVVLGIVLLRRILKKYPPNN